MFRKDISGVEDEPLAIEWPNGMRVQLSFEIYFVIYNHFSLSFLPSFSLQRKRKIYTYRTYRERKVVVTLTLRQVMGMVKVTYDTGI